MTELSSTHVEAEVFAISSDRIGKFWPDVLRFLLMVESPDWTTDEVFEAIRSKEAQVWCIAEDGEMLGIWITRIQKDRHLYGLVWIAAGRGLHKGLPLFIKHVEPWFKSLGCKYVKIVGRKGWSRVLPGYEEHCVELRKTL